MKEFIVTQNLVDTPTAITAADDELIDREEALAIVDGDMEMLQELVGLFMEECPEIQAKIQRAIADKDSRGLERSAHTLKGAIANFGAKTVCEAAQKLELLGRENNFIGVEEAYSALTAELERVKPALTRLGNEAMSEVACLPA